MDKVGEKFKNIGFTYVTLDMLGYRTGSMNEVLSAEEKTDEVALLTETSKHIKVAGSRIE